MERGGLLLHCLDSISDQQQQRHDYLVRGVMAATLCSCSSETAAVTVVGNQCKLGLHCHKSLAHIMHQDKDWMEVRVGVGVVGVVGVGGALPLKASLVDGLEQLRRQACDQRVK